MGQASFDSIQISGFYGPGAWAAWVITMLASWIPLLQGDYTHNLHFIVYAVYTNWAAIDLIRYSSQAFPQDEHDLSDIDQTRLDNMTASFAVVRIGVYQAVWQMLICHRFVATRRSHSKHPSTARRIFLAIGAVIPLSVACSAVLNYSQPNFVSFLLVACLVFGICAVAWTACELLWPHSLFTGFYPLNQFPYTELFFGMIIPLLTFCLVFVINHREDYFRARLTPTRCYFVPCAPQGIGEWDQAFSLLVALFLFFYEFGSHALRIIRKGIKILFPLLEALRSLLYNSGAGVICSTNDNDIGSLLEAGGVPAVQAAGLQGALVPPLQRAFRLTGRARSQATF